jgi:hypothetical protein
LCPAPGYNLQKAGIRFGGEDIVRQMEIADIPVWARGSADPAFFEKEQVQLGRLWTLLGLTTDIPCTGDWFRASLGGRSVFV